MAKNNKGNNGPQNVGIKDSWSLVSFAKGKKMQVGEFVNRDDGSHFKSCIFTDEDGEREFCSFSSNLGELTPKQIAKQKDELQVVLTETDHYILCRQGENNWEDVEL